MAYMLTLLLIAYIQTAGMNLADAALSLVIQLSVGAIAGFLLGKIAVFIINKIDIDNESLYPILLLATAFFTFAATTLCKGNGYLAVYIAGLVVGNAKIVHKKSIGTFFDGFAWLWQIVMFLTQPARTAAGGPYRVNDRYLHDYLRPSDQRVPLPDSL